MKKISKILAVVLCLTIAMSMLVIGSAAATEKCVEFTVTSLGIPSQKYTSTTATVDGVDVEWIQLGNYGNGVQMRDKDGNTSMFWNTSAFPGGITKIELTFNTAKNTYDNTDAVIFTFGNSVKGADYSTKLTTVAGTKTYTITPDADGYTYFYLEHDIGYTFYWDSIKVYYNESEGGNQPEQPEQPEVTIVDIADALAADSGDFTVKGVVTCIDSSNVYVQDATGAICVRMAEKPTDLAVGDTIIGTGSKSVYNGLPQLGSSTYEKSEGCELVAKEVTLDALAVEDICGYVKLSGLTVVEVYDNNGAYAQPNITLTDGENEIELYKAVVGDIKVGDVIDITCALSYYAKGDVAKFQLRNTDASEITVVENDDNGDNGDNGGDDSGEEIPETSDVSVLASILVAACATTGLVVLTKKEQF